MKCGKCGALVDPTYLECPKCGGRVFVDDDAVHFMEAMLHELAIRQGYRTCFIYRVARNGRRSRDLKQPLQVAG